MWNFEYDYNRELFFVYRLDENGYREYIETEDGFLQPFYSYNEAMLEVNRLNTKGDLR